MLFCHLCQKGKRRRLKRYSLTHACYFHSSQLSEERKFHHPVNTCLRLFGGGWEILIKYMQFPGSKNSNKFRVAKENMGRENEREGVAKGHVT